MFPHLKERRCVITFFMREDEEGERVSPLLGTRHCFSPPIL
jgi:hypothetical protein